jgi:transposase
LTGGQIADCTAGAALLEQMPAAQILHGDKGYDSNAIRRQVKEAGAMPNIAPKANRRWKPCFSPVLYRDRNAIERMFCRLKDFRRIATRYDRRAQNFLFAVCIAATVCGKRTNGESIEIAIEQHQAALVLPFLHKWRHEAVERCCVLRDRKRNGRFALRPFREAAV